MSTITDPGLRGYADTASQDRASWLGIMCIYSVETTNVRWDELARKMKDCALNVYVPPEPQDENVWRRIWTDGVRKTLPAPTDAEPQAEQRLMIRLVSKDDGVYTKRVVVEHVAPAGKKLGYEEVVEIVFDKSQPETVNVRSIGDWHDEAWNLVQGLREDYDRQRGCVDGQAIRVMIRAVLEACHSTCLRPGGGVYFVGETFEPRLTALESVADMIPGTLVLAVPLLDSAKHRANVKKAFEYEATSELETLIDEMRDTVRRGDEVSDKKLAAYSRAAKKAKTKLAEYQTLLNDNLGVVDVKIAVMDQLQLQLVGQIKA